MYKKRVLFVFIIGLVAWIALSVDEAKSFSAGAPAGYCNAPSSIGNTCHTCHNTGPAPITVPGLITSGIPAAGYIPATTYTVTATITAAGHNRFGFEISPQDLNGNLMGSMNDLGTETIFQQAGVYITHSSNSLLSNGSKSWQFEWTAPAAGAGNVTFYGAFNITNNDGSYTGDTIVLSTSTWIENTGLYVNNTFAAAANPVVWLSNNTLHISGIDTRIDHVNIYDLNGQLIWVSENIPDQSDNENILTGMPVSFAQGVYVVNIQSENHFWSAKLLNTN